MFVLIEVHTDEVDQTTRMVGTYDELGTAQTVMHQLYSDAMNRNKGEHIEDDLLDDMHARAWWSEGLYDFYDWNIFDTDKK